LTGLNWDAGANRQLNGSQYIYNAFSVDTAGLYQVTMNFNAGPNTINNTGGGYSYYGMGGNFSIEDRLNGTGSNFLWDLGGTGNIDNPLTGVAATYTNTLMLGTGTWYQVNFDHYQYAGFGGPITAQYNTGWSFTITAVPEPSRALLLLAGALGCVTRRRRATA
jgi:hypothetical protein